MLSSVNLALKPDEDRMRSVNEFSTAVTFFGLSCVCIVPCLVA
jgi:hypothetical protein